MAKGKCEQCMWWDNSHERVKQIPLVPGISSPGFCRKHKPAAYAMKADGGFVYHIGIQPITDAHEGCGEFRLEDK